MEGRQGELWLGMGHPAHLPQNRGNHHRQGIRVEGRRRPAGPLRQRHHGMALHRKSGRGAGPDQGAGKVRHRSPTHSAPEHHGATTALYRARTLGLMP